MKTRTRTYKLTERGEEPVWPTSRTLERMGREWARHCYLYGDVLPNYGNTVHDTAAQEEWERLNGPATRRYDE